MVGVVSPRSKSVYSQCTLSKNLGVHGLKTNTRSCSIKFLGARPSTNTSSGESEARCYTTPHHTNPVYKAVYLPLPRHSYRISSLGGEMHACVCVNACMCVSVKELALAIIVSHEKNQT